MKKNRFLLFAGIVCGCLLAISTWYSISFNESRFVKKMDFSSYSFRIQDLPIIIALIVFIFYLLVLIYTIIKTALRVRRDEKKSNYTRRINKNFGFFGFFGLFGFLGIWTFREFGVIYPFLFFSFFGLFGLFYEGKMSNTLMDEMYIANKAKAESLAYKIGFNFMFIIAVALCYINSFVTDTEVLLALLSISISLDLALSVFLSKYLLYRYDYSDAQ
ncbi:MAG: DUF3796 domain-containing protein [Faecalicoccus sp.]|nr:DUF3796 domain-containing protein [Faecalicoccus sp.]